MPLPPDLPSQEAHLIRTNSLAFTNYYYPGATQLPGTRITCVAGCCQVFPLLGFAMLMTACKCRSLHCPAVVFIEFYSHLRSRQVCVPALISSQGCCLQGSHLKGWGLEQMRDWMYAVYSAVSYKVNHPFITKLWVPTLHGICFGGLTCLQRQLQFCKRISETEHP